MATTVTVTTTKTEGDILRKRAVRASDAAARLREDANLMAERAVSAANLMGMAERIAAGRTVTKIQLHFSAFTAAGTDERMTARLYPDQPLYLGVDDPDRKDFASTLESAAFRTVGVAEDEIRQAGIELGEVEP